MLQTLGRASVGLTLTLAGAVSPRAWRARRSTGKTRIACQAYSVHLAQFLTPVVAELQRDADVEVTFLVLQHPQFPLRVTQDLRRFVQDEWGLPPERILCHGEALWTAFDLVLYTDVYAKFPWRAARHAVLMHGAGLTPRMFEPHPLRKSIADFDAVLVNGEYDAREARRVLGQGSGRTRLFVAGFPYLDELEHPAESRATYVTRLGLDPNRPTILFAPHWEALRIVRRTPCYVNEVVAALASLDVNVVLKLHACSLNRAMGGPVDWAAEAASLETTGVLRVDRDLDDVPALRHTDLMITDVSSRSFVFMMLGKPVVLYSPLSGRWDRVSRDRRQLMEQGSVVAADAAEIPALVADAERRGWTNPSGLSVGRECYAYQGRATERVVAILKDVLR
ncbi:MAG: CDP-glycerol glycerophosphotransferase family protein [Vicinamibacterales bacterium]